VKAIRFEGRQAKIDPGRCILCGTCAAVCPQKAKKVNSEIETVENFFRAGEEVAASVAPSFVSSFNVTDFGAMRRALRRLGFAHAEETAAAAGAVSAAYAGILETGAYRNLISSACPAINRMIQAYYPEALRYLAPVLSPMLAHAAALRGAFPRAKIVFLGPCVAKKREAAESGGPGGPRLVDAVLTFEELSAMLSRQGVTPGARDSGGRGDDDDDANAANADAGAITAAGAAAAPDLAGLARYYPISRGIIKSFAKRPGGYEYVACDGVRRCYDVLENIAAYTGLFIEMNCCEYGCVNGPCALKGPGEAIKSNEDVRRYARRRARRGAASGERFAGIAPLPGAWAAGLTKNFPAMPVAFTVPDDETIKKILAKTGKFTAADELNCGACGYSTCREKAAAVANGLADIEMCIPYMRVRAESMSYEIIQNSPNGIMVLDSACKILEINASAREILGVAAADARGRNAYDCFDCAEFFTAQNEGRNVYRKKIRVSETGRYAELSIILLKDYTIMFGLYKDITGKVAYDAKLAEVKNETLSTTDEVIKKQMRVAQEIASLLGETTAETKVALLKLKETLRRETDEAEAV